MTLAWIELFVAGLLEIGWAITLKRTNGFDFRNHLLACVAMGLMMVASMGLLGLAIRSLPIGTAYAVWTGIGVLGTAVLGVVLYHEPASAVRVACLLMLFAGIVGLQLTSPAHGATPPSTQTTLNTIYIGTYTNPGGSEGIYRATFNPATGAIGTPTLAAKTESPSYLSFSPDKRFLYAIAEVDTFDGKKSGAVVAFAVQPDGALRELNRQGSGGSGPCYVSITPDGKVALVANYSGGTVAMLPIADDGSLRPATAIDQHTGKSVDPQRQTKPYAHSIRPDPTGHFALACDLGTDEVIVYRIDGDTMSRATVAKLPAGSGPRHCAFSPDGDTVYVLSEMANTVTRFRWNAETGTLTGGESISTLPDAYKGRPSSTSAEIMVHPSGRFVFTSNRGDDSVAVFPADPTSGRLSKPKLFKTNGSTPRNIVIDPTGRFLIASNQKSDSIVTFAIDPTTGDLKAAGMAVTLDAPCCIRFGS